MNKDFLLRKLTQLLGVAGLPVPRPLVRGLDRSERVRADLLAHAALILGQPEVGVV